MRESAIEARLREGVARIGGRAYKFVSPGNDGVPDRLVCLPGGTVIFVETKAPGKTPRPLQRRQLDLLCALGNEVEVLSSKDAVDAFIQKWAERVGYGI